MLTDVVCGWWMRGEFAEQRGDWQTEASVDVPGADLLQDDASLTAMQQAPLLIPDVDFEVRSVYDSRPINAYDFNFSGTSAFAGEGEPNVQEWSVEFQVPKGYRAVPREWDVFFDSPPTVLAKNSRVSLEQQGAAVPNNSGIIVGMGTGSRPIKSFFVCEENTTFGISGVVTLPNNSTQASTISVNCYGNLIPVNDCALPFTIADQLQNPALINKLLGTN